MDYSADLNILLDSGRNPPSVRSVGKMVEREELRKAMLESAYQHGIKAGIASGVKGINSILNDKQTQRQLDSIYNFQYLTLGDKVVPPVITEAKNIVQNKGGTTLKTTGVVYKIEKQAYFSTLPPNWRQYFSFPNDKYALDMSETPTKEMMPKGSEEYKMWKERTTEGFNEGLNIANKMFEHSLNKLNRDYIGMIRFHEFVLDGKISMPSLSRSSLAVTNTGSTMTIDQKALTIRTLPSFDGNILKWTTSIKPVEYFDGQQSVTINNAE